MTSITNVGEDFQPPAFFYPPSARFFAPERMCSARAFPKPAGSGRREDE